VETKGGPSWNPVHKHEAEPVTLPTGRPWCAERAEHPEHPTPGIRRRDKRWHNGPSAHVVFVLRNSTSKVRIQQHFV
jgi:hypothetical protein